MCSRLYDWESAKITGMMNNIPVWNDTIKQELCVLVFFLFHVIMPPPLSIPLSTRFSFQLSRSLAFFFSSSSKWIMINGIQKKILLSGNGAYTHHTTALVSYPNRTNLFTSSRSNRQHYYWDYKAIVNLITISIFTSEILNPLNFELYCCWCCCWCYLCIRVRSRSLTRYARLNFNFIIYDWNSVNGTNDTRHMESNKQMSKTGITAHTHIRTCYKTESKTNCWILFVHMTFTSELFFLSPNFCIDEFKYKLGAPRFQFCFLPSSYPSTRTMFIPADSIFCRYK